MMTLKRMPRDRKVVEVYDKIPDMVDMVREKVFVLEQTQRDDAFFIVDLPEVHRRLKEWNRLMPRIEPFYALKCNHDAGITRFLADLGVGFDCASEREIQQILNMGVDPSRIVYANPCKPSTHLRYATENGVDLMTFDDILELEKIKKLNPDAKLILRIFSSKEFKAVHNFNKKFGCHPKQVRPLLEKAISLGLNVVGVSFHVGSQPEELACFSSTIEDARDVFEVAKGMGLDLKLLDIGGGYPGEDLSSHSFEDVAMVINESLDVHFPASSGVRIIAEPGRYFATAAFTLAVNVIAKRIVDRDDDPSLYDEDSPIYKIKESKLRPSVSVQREDDDNKLHMYYVNDGVYGSFNNVFTDHAEVYPMLLSAPNEPKHLWSCMWGPTCDGLDSIIPECPLPEMEVGQWIYFHNMGAYTVSISCDFNGIPRPRIYYVCNDEIWDKIYGKCAVDAEPISVLKASQEEVDPTSDEEDCLKLKQTRKQKLAYRLTLSVGE